MNQPRRWITQQLVFSWLVICFFPVLCQAKTLYVSGHRELMVRKGPSLEHKIVAMLKTGQAMTFVREEGDYYLVSLTNGRRGYVLKNYLTGEAPAERRLQAVQENAQQQVKMLEEHVQRQAEELEQLRQENARLAEMASAQAEREFAVQAELQQLQAERGHLFWFLAGAGVLFLGWLLGWTRVGLWRKTRRQGLTF